MADPSSFYGRPAQIAKLPMPGNPAAEMAPGLDAVSRAVTGAVEDKRQTDFQVASINRQRQLQVQTGDVAAKLADKQGELTIDLMNLRSQSQPGAVGYEDAVNERIQRFRDDAHDLLGPDPEVQSRFVDNIASIAATARTGEVKWALEQSAEKSAVDGDQLQNAVQSNIRTAREHGLDTTQMLADADKLDATYVQAQPIPGTVKEKWLKERHQSRLVTDIDARTDIDPHGVIADIDAGKYGEIDDKVLGVLRNQADVAARRIDNEATQAAGAAAGADRARATNAIEDVNAGMLVDVKQLSTWRAQFAASTKPEDIRVVHDLDTAIAKNATTAQFDASTNPERRGALAEIETHKGWQTDQALVAAHTQLQALINRDDQAADHDPLTLYQRQTGQHIGDLRLGDPNAMRDRFVAADNAAKRFEKPVPVVFTAAEADQLRQQFNQATVDGKADFIQTFGAYGSERARQMMHQIAPNKPELVRLAELSSSHDPAVQAIVREASDGSAVLMKEGVAASVRATAQREFGQAMSRLPGDRQAAILQVATWVYAHRAAAAGKAQVLDPELARQAINAALGGTGGKGGVGRRNGNDVVLPMGSTQDDLDHVLTMGAAHPDIVRQAANGTPQWGNRDMHSREWLSLVPVLVNDTGSQALYVFRSPGGSGFVKTNNGRDDYVVDMRKLAGGLQATMGFNAQLATHGYVRR